MRVIEHRAELLQPRPNGVGVETTIRLPVLELRQRFAVDVLHYDAGILRIALEAYLLDKAVYEVGYELNHRPDWVVIPIRGIKHILKST